jgi:hypothetical protein
MKKMRSKLKNKAKEERKKINNKPQVVIMMKMKKINKIKKLIIIILLLVIVIKITSHSEINGMMEMIRKMGMKKIKMRIIYNSKRKNGKKWL